MKNQKDIIVNNIKLLQQGKEIDLNLLFSLLMDYIKSISNIINKNFNFNLEQEELEDVQMDIIENLIKDDLSLLKNIKKPLNIFSYIFSSVKNNIIQYKRKTKRVSNFIKIDTIDLFEETEENNSDIYRITPEEEMTPEKLFILKEYINKIIDFYKNYINS